jgi:acyl carrier protein
MTATRAEIFTALCELLQPFNSAGVALSLTTDISTDLNIDSVTVMDFVMEVEDHFNIEIALNVLSETRTLDDLVSVVEARVNRS